MKFTSADDYNYADRNLLQRAEITGNIVPYRGGGLTRLEDAAYIIEAFRERGLTFQTVESENWARQSNYNAVIRESIAIVASYMKRKSTEYRDRRQRDDKDVFYSLDRMASGGDWETLDSDTMSYTGAEEEEDGEKRKKALDELKAEYDDECAKISEEYSNGNNRAYAAKAGDVLAAEEGEIPDKKTKLSEDCSNRETAIRTKLTEDVEKAQAAHDAEVNRIKEDEDCDDRDTKIAMLDAELTATLDDLHSKAETEIAAIERELTDGKLGLDADIYNKKMKLGKELFERNDDAVELMTNEYEAAERKHLEGVRKNTVPKVSEALAKWDVDLEMADARLTYRDSALARRFPALFYRDGNTEAGHPAWLMGDDVANALAAYQAYVGHWESYITSHGATDLSTTMCLYADIENATVKYMPYRVHWAECTKTLTHTHNGVVTEKTVEEIGESEYPTLPSKSQAFVETPNKEESEWESDGYVTECSKNELIILVGDRFASKDTIKEMRADVFITLDAKSINNDFTKRESGYWHVDDYACGVSSSILHKRITLTYAGVYCEGYMNKINVVVQKQEDEEYALEQERYNEKRDCYDSEAQEEADAQKSYEDRKASIYKRGDQKKADLYRDYISAAFEIMVEGNTQYKRDGYDHNDTAKKISALKVELWANEKAIDAQCEEEANAALDDMRNELVKIYEKYGELIGRIDTKYNEKISEVSSVASEKIRTIKNTATEATGKPTIDQSCQLMYTADLGDLKSMLLEYPEASFRWRESRESTMSIEIRNVIAVLNPRTLTGVNYSGWIPKEETDETID